jgi:two-component system OmpR family response regulator
MKGGRRSGRVRILITEDDAALGEALRFKLAHCGYAVDWVQNGALADKALRDSVFDLLILDLGLPQLDGYDVLKRLRRHDGRIPVLILSGRESAGDKVHGLDLGADDYLVKPFSLEELQARVRALLRRGNKGSANPLINAAELTFDTVERVASVGGRALDLSMHETAVLEALLSRLGKVVSKEQLVEQIYNYDRDVGYNAIEVYVHRLRKKIEGSGLAVKTLYGRGYALEANG